MRARQTFDTAVRGTDGDFKGQDTDIFLSVFGVMYVIMHNKKPKARELHVWIIQKGIEKMVEEQKLAIETKNTEIALPIDNLGDSEKRIQKLEYENVGLQGEIRAKDTMLLRLQERHVDHEDPGLDNVVMIVRKHASYDDLYSHLPYYVARIQRRAVTTKRRWLKEKFPNSEEIVVIDNPNSVHAFNRFEEEDHVERYKCHFRLVDFTRDHLYDMGIPPAIEE